MDTDKLTKTQYREYQKQMDSLIKHNLIHCKDERGRRYWQFKGGPDCMGRLEELHLEAMVAVLDNPSR